MRAPCPLYWHTGEKKALSCSQKTSIFLTLRNIGVHQAITSENHGNWDYVSLYISLWQTTQQSSEPCTHVYFLCSLGLFSCFPGQFQKFVRHSSVTEQDKNVNICYNLLFFGHSGIPVSQVPKMPHFGHGCFWFILWIHWFVFVMDVEKKLSAAYRRNWMLCNPVDNKKITSGLGS